MFLWHNFIEQYLAVKTIDSILKFGTLLVCLLLLVITGCQQADPSANSLRSKKWQGQEAYQQVVDWLYSRPLADVPAGTSSATRFEVLGECGVDFRNYTFKHRSRLLQNGSGVAVADYDGDGLIDILSLIHI